MRGISAEAHVVRGRRQGPPDVRARAGLYLGALGEGLVERALVHDERPRCVDDRRLVRLYGTSTVIAHLNGDGKRARLYLLSYTRGGGRGAGGGGGGAGAQPIRVRLLGHYQPVTFAAYGAAEGAKLLDVETPGNSTEFSVPPFNTLAVIDLEAKK